MATYRVISNISGQSTFTKPQQQIIDEFIADLMTCKLGEAVEWEKKTVAQYITGQQRKWYKGVCLPWLKKHDENQESTYWWDDEVKRYCNGLALLKKQVFFTAALGGQKIPIGRLTTSGVGKKNMTAFIEEILAMSVEKNWGLSPPDKDLRK